MLRHHVENHSLAPRSGVCLAFTTRPSQRCTGGEHRGRESKWPTLLPDAPVLGDASQRWHRSCSRFSDSSLFQSQNEWIVETTSSNPRRTQKVKFTCNLCGCTTISPVNPHAMAKGSVFARCQGCNVIHKVRLCCGRCSQKLGGLRPCTCGPGSAAPMQNSSYMHPSFGQPRTAAQPIPLAQHILKRWLEGVAQGVALLPFVFICS